MEKMQNVGTKSAFAMFMCLYSSQYNCLYIHVSSIYAYVLIYILSFLYAKIDTHTCTHIQIYVYAWCNRFIYFTYENLRR